MNVHNKISERNYKCPCGKTYLSYPALFTHVKQKHDGKAPGEIQKPKLKSRPRGRPRERPALCTNHTEKDSSDSEDPVKGSDDHQQLRIYLFNFQTIFVKLRQIIFPQDISQDIWHQVYSFSRFEQFIDNTEPFIDVKDRGVNIGVGLIEFLKEVSTKTQNWRFQQVLLLFMLLLQYMLDENDSSSMIQSAPIQSLVEYMNPFSNYHISDYAQFLEIDTLWIMNKNNMHSIFMCFYNWLKWKKYTDFCITLID